MRTVEPSEWTSAIASLATDGHVLLDLLTAIDRPGATEVVVHVVDPVTLDRFVVTTTVVGDDPHLGSLTATYPAAAWHERETAEMFGITFDGHPDPRPLLLRTAPTAPPLRTSTPLVERLATPWPGADEEDDARRSRRRSLPPGVRASWVEGA